MSASNESPFADAMMRKYGGTEWAGIEIFQLGEAVINAAVTVAQLGHSSPASVLDYLPSGLVGSAPHDFLYDFIAWTSGRKHLRPGCEDRIRNEIREGGWQQLAAERLDAIFARPGGAA